MASFADLVKNNKNTDKNNSEQNNNRQRKEKLPPANRRHHRIVNRMHLFDYKQYNSYETWEYKYFPYLLRASDLFAKELIAVSPELEDYLSSFDFLRDFCKFTYYNSSGRISDHLEPMNYTIEKIYNNYLLSNNNGS